MSLVKQYVKHNLTGYDIYWFYYKDMVESLINSIRSKWIILQVNQFKYNVVICVLNGEHMSLQKK